MDTEKIIGTVVPISALKSNILREVGSFGVGREFLQWLHKNNQGAWQFLPIHETPLEPNSSVKHLSSPYKSYGIGLNPKYLSHKYLTYMPTTNELNKFMAENSIWLPNYALFCSLRNYYQTDNWSEWDVEIRDRQSDAIKQMTHQLSQNIQEEILMQFRLHQDYRELQTQAKAKRIILLGDLSFYIGYSSPLVWANQNLFDLTPTKTMAFVSGLPDGPKAHFGRQVWGHPLYLWGENNSMILDLWKLRMQYSAKLFDWVRLDHAKGFFHYGAIDVNDEKNDQLKDGLGTIALEELIKFSKNIGLKIFAEDSGDRLKELKQILHKFRIPGIKILRYALTVKGGEEKVHSTYAELNLYDSNLIAYTTTHDTETLLGYLKLLTQKQKKLLAKIVVVDYHKNNQLLAINLRTAVINSPAMIVMIPIQDWLLTEDRINLPGTEKAIGDRNWQYQLNIPVEQLISK